MVWIILIAGFVIIAYCLGILIAPNFLRKTVDFFSIGSRLYVAGLLRLVLGVMLLILSTQARFWGYVVIVGLVFSASGLSLFFLALRRIKKILGRLQNQPNFILRLFAITGLTIWVLLIYSLLPAVPH